MTSYPNPTAYQNDSAYNLGTPRDRTQHPKFPAKDIIVYGGGFPILINASDDLFLKDNIYY